MMMKQIKTFMFLFSSIIIFSQTTHNVTVQNFSFSPQEITINVGDIVKWTNILGTHNVRADDNSFYYGPAAPAPWEFTHTFTAVGFYPYYCEPHGGPGGSGMSGVIVVQNPVGVDDDEISANKFELKQNYPNPFNPSTRISYSLPSSSFVYLKVFDILGNEVASLVNEEKLAGNYQIEFNASELSGGIYFYQLKTNSFVETKKMILMK
jgi:plastocyanin